MATTNDIATLQKRIAELEMQSMFLRSSTVRNFKLPAELTAAALREHVKPLEGAPGYEVVGLYGERLAKLGSADDFSAFDQAIGQLVKQHPRGSMIVNGANQSAAGQGATAQAPATGPSNSSGHAGTLMRRRDWEALSAIDRAAHFKAGGRITD